MKKTEEKNINFDGFSKLKRKERFARLQRMGALTEKDIQFLEKSSPMDLETAELFIENVIGYFPLSLGVATHFVIDGKSYVIPMAVEETSIIAAASKTAKWIKQTGSIETEVQGHTVIGQVQISKLKNERKLTNFLNTKEKQLIEELNAKVAAGLVRRGGGVKKLSFRRLKRPDGDFMGVIHIYVDACDAMGANIVNQVCEYLKIPLEKATQEKITMSILSNLVDSKITKARICLNNIKSELCEKIEEASLFAQMDPYRACTNNKGVLNGIDPILIATGNDWRAVEAGLHAYASRKGSYSSITRWFRRDSQLIGEFEAPLIVGVVGGVTRLHPVAQMCLRMMNIKRANELSQICAAVGLAANLGALKALTTVGIINGHMKLHINNLSMSAGAKKEEMPLVKRKLEGILNSKKRISLQQAVEALDELRSQQPKVSSEDRL